MIDEKLTPLIPIATQDKRCETCKWEKATYQNQELHCGECFRLSNELDNWEPK